MRKPSGEDGDSSTALASIHEAQDSSGQHLPDGLRTRFEQSTGMDLSGVRLHTGAASNKAALSVGATAYAVGNDIHFANGAYQPDSRHGQELIAHEVFHTLQSVGQPTGAGVRVSESHDHAELEADTGAAAMVLGEKAAAPTEAASGVVHRKKNSYSAQEGLTWEGGSEIAEDEMKAWAAQKSSLATAAAGYISWATGFSLTTGAGDLVEKLKKEAMSDYEKEVETLEYEVAGCEDQVDNWDDKRTSGSLWWKKIDPKANENYQHWKKLLAEAEADLEKLEDQESSREARALQQATQVAGAVNSFASSAASTAQAVGSELGLVAPTQFKSITDATGKIGKVISVLNFGAKLFDRTALNNFQTNPNLQTAEAWANHIGSTFESVAGFASGLPGGWGTVISTMMSMPGIVTKNFLSVMKKRYDRIDAETRDNNGGSKMLKEGESG